MAKTTSGDANGLIDLRELMRRSIAGEPPSELVQRAGHRLTDDWHSQLLGAYQFAQVIGRDDDAARLWNAQQAVDAELARAER